MEDKGLSWEWAEILRGLDNLQEVEAELQGHRLRPPSNPQMTQMDADGEKDKTHAVIESSAQGRASIAFFGLQSVLLFPGVLFC